MTSVRPVGYLAARKGCEKSLSATRPAFKTSRALEPGEGVGVAKHPGRPDVFESRRRTARFLQLVAAGMTLRDAAREAGVKPDRALDLVQDRDEFDRQVQALREAA